MSAFTPATGNGLVRKDSIEELCGHRARALELYALVETTLAEARKAHALACVGKTHITIPPLNQLDYHPSNGEFARSMREIVDRDMWQGLLNNTSLGSLMDVEERRSFQESLKNPPEITPDAVFLNMSRLVNESAAIFRRGLVNAFANLNRDYKSHDGFKIGERLVLTYIVTAERWDSATWWVRFTTYAEERLRDLDRVFHVLDGKQAPDYQQGLCAAMRTAMKRDGQTWEVKTPYFRVKWFKNGNAHLHLIRDDLIRRANLLIAEHYGQAVGAAPDVATKGHNDAPPPEPCLTDFFETPPELVEQMIATAEVEAHHTVLEPSAGEAAIAKPLSEIVLDHLTCYEADQGRYETLARLLPYAIVEQRDFLRTTPRPLYDRILMNPPFSRGVDALHVLHALKFLAPGGRLVAIMSAGLKFRSDAATVRLRNQIEQLGGAIADLPAGTFKPSGTLVNTVMLTINVP
jgi:hypothetical protein